MRVDQQRWEQVKSIVADAIALAPQDRSAFIAAACQDDDDLRREVESLLESHDQAGDLFENSPLSSSDIDPEALTQDVSPSTGTRVGAYELVRELGRGGMGTVFLAVRADHEFDKRVPIKLIRRGMENESVVRRFRNERQILARLEHPNIARLIDGGTTENALPYFVMERVSGVPLCEYADANKLTIKDRVRLFTQVCRAVQHAHQKGVVHRDLKPSNVLVTDSHGAPTCKVIDFGIAKTVNTLEAARLTMTGISLGTPAYMSPEQARGEADVDTRADVYSLGATLYELLAGVLPFESKSSFGMLLMTQRGDAPMPSRRFAALPEDEQNRIAQLRGVDPAGLRRLLREDLDWIVLKAIEHDRELRYQTVVELLSDLDRHFADQAVSVGPPSGAYRAKKFVRRHRLAVAFAGTTAALLVVFSVSVAVQARRLAVARNAALQRQGQAEDLIGFMLGDLRERLTTVGRLEMLDGVAKKAMDYFASVPERDLSNEELFRRSQALSQLGEVRVSQGKTEEATVAFQQSLALAKGLAHRDSFNGKWQLGLGASHYWVGYMHFRRNDLDSAMTHFAEYVRIAERLAARSPDSLTYLSEVGLAVGNIGSTREAMGDLRGALEAFQKRVVTFEDLVRRDGASLQWRHELGNAYNTVGVIQRKVGDLRGAEKSHRAELAIKQTIVSRDTANRTYRERVALAQAFVGDLLIAAGKPAEAAEPLSESRAGYAALAAFDTANPERLRVLANADRLLGVLALERGDVAEGMRTARASLSMMESLAARNPANALWQYNLARSLTLLGDAQLALGRDGDAQSSQSRALGILEPAIAKKPTDINLRYAVTEAQLDLGDARMRSGNANGAKAAWSAALTAIDSLAKSRQFTDHLVLRATALLRLDRIDEARPVVTELLRRGYRRPRWMKLLDEKHVAPAS